MRKVMLLWSGGFDSTYRLCQLSRQDVEVELVYVYGYSGGLVQNELEARRKILSLLHRKHSPRATFTETEYSRDDDIPQNAGISAAFARIRPVYGLAPCYEIVSRLAAVRPGLEIGLEGPTGQPGHMSRLLLGSPTHMLFGDDGVGTISPSGTDRDVYTVFGNFSFPVITTGEDKMLEWYRREGFSDVLRYVRFCSSMLPYPCGVCGGCLIKVRHGIGRDVIGLRGMRNNMLMLWLGKHYGSSVAREFVYYIRCGRIAHISRVHMDWFDVLLKRFGGSRIIC